MNYLTDGEIMEWNSVIKDINYTVIPMYNHKNGYPNIKFNTIKDYYSNMVYVSPDVNPDVLIKHHVIFSILESGLNFFNKIKDNIFSFEIMNEVTIAPDKYEKIDLSKLKVIINEENILFKGRKYIKYNYELEGKTSEVMTYYSLLKRCLNFFEKSWGQEGLILKFKIGDVVTNIGNNIDMVIIDYYFNIYSDRVDYVTADIISKNSYLLYDNKKNEREDKLILSRNNIIETLLEE
jgi:hypothetical protein